MIVYAQFFNFCTYSKEREKKYKDLIKNHLYMFVQTDHRMNMAGHFKMIKFNCSKMKTSASI